MDFQDDSEKRLFIMSGAVVALIIISIVILSAGLTAVFFVVGAFTIIFALYTTYRISKQETVPQDRRTVAAGRKSR